MSAGAERRVQAAPDIPTRIEGLDWEALGAALWAHGAALTIPVLSAGECAALAALFGEDALFRKRIDMARHRFGLGAYAYFAEPLPPDISALRLSLYRKLAPLANGWNEALGRPDRFPEELEDYLARCGEQGQARPTPLLLRYTEGGNNRLHQDLYGPMAFPFQVVCMLSRPGRDFTGGEFLLVSQPPRQQGLGEALSPKQGALAIFPCRERPFPGARGWLRAGVRHGVSRVMSGERVTLGIIFHNAL